MTVYQQLKHREEKCIIAGINASDPRMVRMWQGNAMLLDEKRRKIESQKNIENNDLSDFTFCFIEYLKRPMSNFDRYKLKYELGKEITKLFPKSGKIIADALNGDIK
jgi:hypothetical protein